VVFVMKKIFMKAGNCHGESKVPVDCDLFVYSR